MEWLLWLDPPPGAGLLLLDASGWQALAPAETGSGGPYTCRPLPAPVPAAVLYVAGLPSDPAPGFPAQCAAAVLPGGYVVWTPFSFEARSDSAHDLLLRKLAASLRNRARHRQLANWGRALRATAAFRGEGSIFAYPRSHGCCLSLTLPLLLTHAARQAPPGPRRMGLRLLALCGRWPGLAAYWPAQYRILRRVG